MKHGTGPGDPAVGDDASGTDSDDVIQVPVGAAALAEALEHRGDGTFVADIQDWDKVDETP